MRKKLERLNDTELALLARGGEVRAFEEIYDRHSPGIARILASYAGPDRDTVDDLTQEVFYRVVAGLDSYVPSHPFSHWLYTVALNVGRNHARRRSVVVMVDPGELDGVSGGGDRPLDWTEEIIGETLICLVSRLPDRMREVVSLRIGSGMSYGEIAEILGIPEGTARSRMHNAVGILRGKMGIIVSKKEKK